MNPRTLPAANGVTPASVRPREAGIPLGKRVFDLAVVALVAPIWIPTLLFCSLLVLILTGWPVLYISKRRVARHENRRIAKFRAMVRNAERLVNRDTVPVSDQAFLNVTLDSPVYTGVGRLLERASLTELPQLFHVLSGKMTLVGNRPLPENVIAALKTRHPEVEERFASRTGMTGPVQLAGRDRVSDGERLRLEIAYSRRVMENYSPILDLKILVFTVLRCVGLMRPRSIDELLTFLGLDAYRTATVSQPGSPV